MKTTRIFLLIAFLAIMGVGLLQFIFGIGPTAVGRFLIAQIGSGIGVTVSITPNPFNILAEQLEEKESELSAKEVALEQKETAQKEDEEREKKNNRTAFAYFAVGGGSLLVLILLNFYLDY